MTAAIGLTACKLWADPKQVSVGKTHSATNPSPMNSFVAYAGSERCRSCHAEAYADWAKSHHGLAERTLRADLDTLVFEPSRTFSHGSQSTETRRTNGQPQIVTLGFNNKREAYPVERVIGHDPLRQFLTAIPGGRLQVHEASFDPRSNQWFNVYGTEDRQPGEWGHWTGRGMNWNSMCAACHNTRLLKNYDETRDAYHTTMVEPSVGCEACHGPMKDHVEWSTQHKNSTATDPTVKKLSKQQMLDTCGSCHARRAELTGDFKPGDKFSDDFDLVTVDASEIFYPDGQIHDEDYEFNAFLGSRMHAAGVKCGDCHQPHTSKIILPGNVLCMRCHSGGVTNAPVINPVTHSHHQVFGYDAAGKLTNSNLTAYRPKEIKQTGGECVNCHMPQTVYMQRHWRHDHGFTIPDPQLTKDFNIPNACNRCHTDKDTAWSLDAVQKWYGTNMNRPTQQRARCLAEARLGKESACEPLLRLLATNEIPFWKAVTASLLEQWAAEPRVTTALTNLLHDDNPLVRAKAAQSLAPLVEMRIPGVEAAMRERLNDQVRNVRFAVGWALRETLETNSPVAREILQTIQNNADQPIGQAQHAVWQMAHGEVEPALAHYAKAIAWDSNSPPFRIDYAATLSLAGQSSNALTQIQAACRLAPKDAENFYRLGLAWNEVGNLAQTVVALEEAVRLNPRYDRALYNLGLVYNQQGDSAKAIETLKRAESANVHDARASYALAIILAQTGRKPEAIAAARRAIEIQPDYSEALELLRSLTR